MTDEEKTAQILALRPELNEAIMKAAPEYFNREIDKLIRIAESLEQPLAIICADEKGEPLTFATQQAFDNRTWMLGALDEAKDEIKYPLMLEVDEDDEAAEE